MKSLIRKYKIIDPQWILTISIVVSAFLYSGYNTERFQHSREDVQIESLLDLHSQKVEAISFWDIFETNPVFNTYLFSGYDLFQLRGFNTRLLSYLNQLSNSDFQKDPIVFFLAKTIPLCSDEDSLLPLPG